MSNLTPILTLRRSTEAAVSWMTQQLLAVGLQVERTFDLQAARLAHADCPCPHHGTNACNCQMVILLVRCEGWQPLTVIAHGYDGQTSLSLVDTDSQPMEMKVIQALIPLVESSEI